MEIDWKLLERYVAGECNPAERERFEIWLTESPTHRQVLYELREVAVQSRHGVAAEREAQLLAELRMQLQLQPPSVLRVVSTQPLVRRSHWSGTARAAVLAMLLVGGAVVAGVVRSMSFAPSSAINSTRRVITTPRGQRIAFNLPDGSRVILGAVSTLDYPASFGVSRDVQLRGEAYFDVEHDERHPFVVHAGNLVATDLGTQFGVRAYSGDSDESVVVRQGKVGLRAAGSKRADAESVMAPGELGRLSASGRPVIESVDPETYLAWTEGRLVFDGTPLSKAILDLERWYDVEFQLADATVGSRDLYASFRNQSLTSILDEVAPTLQLRYERRGRVIVLHSLDTTR